MKQKTMLFSIFLGITILALTACAAPPLPESTSAPASIPTEKPPTATSVPTPSATPLTESLMPRPTLSPDMQKIAEQAANILSQSLKVSPEDVTILSVQRVEWSNASLGCPKPGMMYAQMITPGYLIKAEVNGEVHEVHMNENGHGVVCPPDRAKEPIRVDESKQ